MKQKAETAQIAEALSGDKLYQERARAALPLLVRQAQAGNPIFYSDLAAELGIPNPRNLNYVLGSIGQALTDLSKLWGIKVPPIQCLVVNKATGLPGEGIGWFVVKKEDYSKLTKRQQRTIVEAELQHVYAFPQWHKVLSALQLQPTDTDFTQLIKAATTRGGSGEGDKHKKLKEFVANHPQVIGLSAATPRGIQEFALPSGDSIDVMFQNKDWVAVEVKSAISQVPDILRGLFQCVKYRAVIEAVQATESLPQNARALLVLEGALPIELLPIKNLLGIEVIEHVSPTTAG
ncbi:MAG: hypothetical protein JSR23_11125 [Proteobacteria bacterium]|nr:hypothetical protein [Pseudomonadota bacterium]